MPILLGVLRAHDEASKGSGQYRADEAAQAGQESDLQLRRKGVGKFLVSEDEAPLVVPDTAQASLYDVNTDEAREGVVDVDKIYS